MAAVGRPRQLVLSLIGVIVAFFALLSVSLFALVASWPEWTPPTPPTAAQLVEARRTAPVPTFWFGPVANGGRLSELTRGVDDRPNVVELVYGLYCEEYDPGSGLSCDEKARVSNEPRNTSTRPLTRRRSCWKPYGKAWVLKCGEPFRLYTGSRMTEFFWAQASDPSFSVPWRESVTKLQRFDADGAAAAGVPATTRFTCRELRNAWRRHKLALPAAIRPLGACVR